MTTPDVVIKLEGLGKRYRIGSRQPHYQTLRETFVDLLAAPYRRIGTILAGAKTEAEEQAVIWALKGVSFDVRRGEVVGLIGRNGAGKSTLLKVLSRITEPTEGRVGVCGRVGSLLEVGTGFHPELTGRENIYLNGAILGMRRGEINARFDEIVAFAEIERFLDTQVKHYSSGMYMRLAFAVAAHLDPEILLVDEVLAVGDASFQKKCLAKMKDVGQKGRTVFFVSHNTQAITRLCGRCVLLENGRVLRDGPAHQVVADYLGCDLPTTAVREWPDVTRAPGDDTVRLRAIRARSASGTCENRIEIRQPIEIEIEYEVLQPGRRLSPGFTCRNEDGIALFSSYDLSPTSLYSQDPTYIGCRRSSCVIPGNFFAEGVVTFSVSVNAILDGNQSHAHELDAISIQVVDSFEGDSARGLYGGPFAGIVRPRLAWSTRPLEGPREEPSATRSIP